MDTGRFIIKATSNKMLVRMVVTVRSTEACMDGRIRETQNTFFDMLRILNFDACKIEFPLEDPNGVLAGSG